MSELGFAWKRKARGETRCTHTHAPCCADEAGLQTRAPSGVCSVPVDEKRDLLARFSPAAFVCLPGPGGCGLSSVVLVRDFGFSGDVSSLSQYPCLLHVYKNIEDEYIIFKISHHWAALFGC